MMTAPPSTPVSTAGELPLGAVVAAVSLLAGGWIAAGSMGVLAGPFQVALTCLALLIAVTAAPPSRGAVIWLAVVATALLLLPVLCGADAAHGVLAVAAIGGVLAAGQSGLTRKVLVATAAAIALLGVYRVAYVAIPVVWQGANTMGQWLGSIAAAVGGRPLWVGATFGGIDFLVLILAATAGWLLLTPRPRWRRTLLAVAAILAAHLLYLLLLASSSNIEALLPESPFVPPRQPYIPPPWHWSNAVRACLPWHMPAIAAVLDLVIAVALLRWVRWSSDPRQPESATAPRRARQRSASPRHAQAMWIVAVLALALPIVTGLSLGQSDLTGKTIVVNAKGYLDWQTPEYGQYGQQSAGIYGMLPTLVESLGGRLQRSEDLSEADLDAADVLMLLQPTRAWTPAELRRISDYVDGGGALLVVGGPQIRRNDRFITCNDPLRPTGMYLRQDVAMSDTDDWQQAWQGTYHPITLGIVDGRRQATSNWAASIRTGWRSRPWLVGRWGWSDPGSDALLTGGGKFEPGEKLGDLVLAAEQPLGAGTVAVLGDSSLLTNEGIVRSWPVVGRLLSYLSGGVTSPQVWWRQLLGIGLCLALVAAIVRASSGGTIAVAAAALAVSLTVSVSIGRHMTRVVPRLPADGATQLAYIDAAHVEAYSDLEWGFDGIDGLSLTLMRNGFLPLLLPDLTRARLDHARLFVSVAPARSFSTAERQLVRQFVAAGGLMICTVGAEEARPSASLLADFGIQVPYSPVPAGSSEHEPEPMGHIRSIYFDAKKYGAGDYQVGVRFFAGWPVVPLVEDVEVLVRGAKNRPIVVARQLGRGVLVVVGDTGFAMNKNLEYIGGEPFDGRYENADFWRWLITRVSGQEEWIPPEPPPQEDSPPTDSETEAGS